MSRRKSKLEDKGVYLNTEQKLKLLIPKIKANFIDQLGNILHFKFSADSAQIVKHKSFVNFTFTILNEEKSLKLRMGIIFVIYMILRKKNMRRWLFVSQKFN